VSEQDGEHVYEGLLTVWPAWREAAAVMGGALLFVGAVRVDGGADVMTVLGTAASAGLLAGGLVGVRLVD
jgi:hypothetical protein